MSDYDFLPADYGDMAEITGLYRSLIGAPSCTWSSDYPSEEDVRSDIENKSLYVLKENGVVRR